MIELWAVLVPILLVDVVNPVLLAAMVYVAGTARPVLNSSVMLLGHTLAYFIAGILLALGLEQIIDRIANPGSIDFVIGLLIGFLLLWVAVRSTKKEERKAPDESGTLSPMKAFGFGAIVNFVGLPFALPYFAALDQLLKADLSTLDTLVLLLAYNGLYAIPFLIVPILSAVLGERAQTVLERVNQVVDRVSAYLMPALLGLVGLALIADAMTFFFTGKGLF